MFKKLVLTISVLLAAASAAFAQTQVSGTVTDPSGAPLPGVYVYIEGTNVGTVTDAKGEYTLAVREGDAVKFNFFGMRDVLVAYDGKPTINVQMVEDSIGLDEVVVTATGMTRQEKTLGYASTTVRSDGTTASCSRPRP